MPELAEVEYYRKQWSPGIGRTVERVSVHPKARVFRDTSPSGIRKQLTGERLLGSHRHGKQWLFEFSNGKWLSGHLGMTGRLEGADVEEYGEGKHDHLVLFTDAAALVFSDSRMFGKVGLDITGEGGEFPAWWKQLPPEVLSDRFTRKHVSGFVARHRKIPVKTLLLDQRAFPGIGNWMADEVCWRVPVHPSTPAGELSDARIAALRRQLRTVSRQALRVIGTDWGTPPNAWLFNHRWKDGGRCPRKECGGAALVRADLRGRTTAWCPRCQGEGASSIQR